MSNDREPLTVWHLVGAGIIVWLVYQSMEQEPAARPEPEPPGISTGFLSDVRIKLNSKSHRMVSDFIRTGKLSKDRVGVDMTAVESIRCLPGRLVFNPPIRVDYDGPGPLNAGTTIKEIRLGSDGEILVDVVNSPIDLVVEEDE